MSALLARRLSGDYELTLGVLKIQRLIGGPGQVAVEHTAQRVRQQRIG